MSDAGDDFGKILIQHLKNPRFMRYAAEQMHKEHVAEQARAMQQQAQGDYIKQIDFQNSKDAQEFCDLAKANGVEAQLSGSSAVIRRKDFEKLPLSDEIKRQAYQKMKTRSPRLREMGEQARCASKQLSRDRNRAYERGSRYQDRSTRAR